MSQSYMSIKFLRYKHHQDGDSHYQNSLYDMDEGKINHVFSQIPVMVSIHTAPQTHWNMCTFPTGCNNAIKLGTHSQEAAILTEKMPLHE